MSNTNCAGQGEIGKVQWSMLAILALTSPALILYGRLKFMCHTLELGPFAFLPLSAVVNGRDPHLIARIMHNITHSALLLCYAVVLTFVAARSIGKPLNAGSSRLLFSALTVVHLSFLISYMVGLMLPIGDLVQVIAR